MPTISNKGHSMPESPIRKLVPHAEKAIKNGKHIYHLNIGQPDIKTPEIALQAVKDNDIDILAYSNSKGEESYRKKLVSYYHKNDINISIDDIIVTTGASEALYFLFSSIMDPNDEVIICEPFYANYIAFSIASGVNVVPAISKIEDNFSLPSIEAFEKLITKKTKAILICNPGNPTGYLYSKEEIQNLAVIAKTHDLFLIADEVYREFVYDGNTHYSILHEKGLDEHTIMIDSVSKRYSMCGARIGCLISKNKTIMQTVLKFAQARLSPPSYAQIACEAALDTPQSYFDDVAAEYVDRRNTLVEELQKIDNIKVAMPKGAFYCMVELPIKNSDNFAKWLLEDFDVNGETIMVAPAAGFYSTPSIGLNQIRIAYVLKKESLIKAVGILKEALKVYKD
ncbi:aspartate aminotransferase [Flavivirga aquatica]|uniref:Aminotransferase n=1 Tax=Flavivirga aquatica TaxID=1849968 RepID=A0A1E5TCA4_9FLAO|nr:pyridoxal phosphate-dependent aminotransferase [Flavivirga aquatica]OEK09004.1 aspartate aminotransferase [Flavivirga aquatica]